MIVKIVLIKAIVTLITLVQKKIDALDVEKVFIISSLKYKTKVVVEKDTYLGDVVNHVGVGRILGSYK